ncbi:c-type cytochrome [Alienimonas chondri]|uniref:c-type cytochrome n=1 Tax=Alienimonas chondri TaxID=2681879 RepID=UPI0019D694F4|nr:c-type cytochrome [Alienimonas chondri]
MSAAPPGGADAEPHWIWAPGEATANQTVRLRKAFEGGPRPKSATLTVAADNEAVVWLDGTKVLSNNAWDSPSRADVTALGGGRSKVLSVQAKNADGPAGVLVMLDLEYPDGSKKRIVSDGSWKVAPEGTKGTGWATPGFVGAEQWESVVDKGAVGVQPWGKVLDGKAPAAPGATPADEVELADGYAIELLYSVPKEEQGSWVSMTVDPQGRLIVSDQYGKLYRVTPPPVGDDAAEIQIEPIDVETGMAHGLLCAFDSLYVMVNDGGNSGLYRVRDTDGDDQYDVVEKLQSLNGRGEHGPHAMREGADGRLWVIAGNETKLPEGYNKEESAVGNFAEDLLLPRNPDGNGHATGRMAPGGWIGSCTPDGTDWHIHAAGFRNPYDFAVNADGEIFTFDADMEWDTGTPWYRPTRLNHAVRGGEFGWRFGTGKWPEYYADSVGSVVDLGLGSPTGVEFAAGTHFPNQDALFLADWTHGRVFEVTMTPRGASYDATFRTFLSGRPLPVTDLSANSHDGALYMTTGGRRTQSGLYRIRYTGDAAPSLPAPDATAEVARRTRHMLERGMTGEPVALDALWPHLGSRDRAIRYAARVALERHPVADWKDEFAHESRPNAVIQAAVAVARVGDQADRSLMLDKLDALNFKRLTTEQILDALRAYQLAFIRLGGHPSDAHAETLAAKLVAITPSPEEAVNREAVRLLTYLATSEPIPPSARGVVTLAMDRLRVASTQADQMFYPFMLRNLTGRPVLWSGSQYETFFGWLNLAETTYRGGNSFKKFVAQIRKDAVDKLPEGAKTKLADVITAPAPPEDAIAATTRQFVANWQTADFGDPNTQMDDRDLESGRQAYLAVKCAQCHRFDGEGGSTGPDLTGVGGRFDARYLLEAILEPSKVVSDQYKSELVLTDEGQVYNGRVTAEEETHITVRTDPFGGATVDVPLDSIIERAPSETSEMPNELVSTLEKSEILDLIAYLRAGAPATTEQGSSEPSR